MAGKTDDSKAILPKGLWDTCQGLLKKQLSPSVTMPMLLARTTLIDNVPYKKVPVTVSGEQVQSSPAQLPIAESLTRQSLSLGPVHPAAHWLWQQSLGDLPRQRREHCWAQMILVTEKERSREKHCQTFIFICTRKRGSGSRKQGILHDSGT